MHTSQQCTRHASQLSSGDPLPRSSCDASSSSGSAAGGGDTGGGGGAWQASLHITSVGTSQCIGKGGTLATSLCLCVSLCHSSTTTTALSYSLGQSLGRSSSSIRAAAGQLDCKGASIRHGNSGSTCGGSSTSAVRAGDTLWTVTAGKGEGEEEGEGEGLGLTLGDGEGEGEGDGEGEGEGRGEGDGEGQGEGEGEGEGKAGPKQVDTPLACAMALENACALPATVAEA